MRVFRVDPMASRVWQACVRRLTTQSEITQHNIGNLLNEWCFLSSGRTFLPSYGDLGGRTRAAGGKLWNHSRFYNVGGSAGKLCGRTSGREELASVENFGGRILSPFSRWKSAMQNSSISSDVPDASQNPPSDNVSTEIEVEKPEDQEFIPPNADTPTTPLVQAIRHSLDEEVSPMSKGSFEEILPADREIDPLRVFVGGLPFSVKGDELKKVLHSRFSEHGVVQDIQLSHHRDQSRKSLEAGKHKGFAFVTMGTPEEAQAVIAKLNGDVMWSRSITVNYALKSLQPDASARERQIKNVERLARRKVFVGNLHEDTSIETLEQKFSQFGALTRSKLIYDLGSGRSRGFGFITFEDEASAMKAILDLDGSILDGSVIRVNIAKYPQTV
ncbi:hypothetical protein MPTK1_3g06220 [Marchantia polymorpha subsp. ruderalis]|uniref:RRM domain-containing protein n=2 Tax=Marchantia polymorpha TaxID=3197 RepID=A0AAF6AXY4_MARPO|nr:hypothetical protein MARPO_0006s0092 [Marchantia polymorpha]BBN04618.1 hypothetical protein Mp_3g06220 [Marchantia polymorpha subsp. ruderalis]|eukprot:PTQ48054.1 hypothetical protein MARPO_0006s0092 [Marchantia polymorpha]